MSISAKDVMKLRESTGAGMMDCKKALTETNGDFDKAVEYLRKKGQQVSEKRADREANQGLVLIHMNEDKKSASAIELNCETDFVARNEDFQAQGEAFLKTAYANKSTEVDSLLSKDVNGMTIEKHLDGMVGKKIEISKVVYVETNGTLVEYIHPGNQLGVLVEFDGELKDDETGKDVAMQIAAIKTTPQNRQLCILFDKNIVTSCNIPRNFRDFIPIF